MKFRNTNPFWIGLLFAMVWLGATGPAVAQSLDIPHPHYGLSFGNSKTFNGLRFNLADEEVNTVRGLNTTVFNWPEHYDQPYTETAGRIDGLALGLLGPRAREVNGLALGFWLSNAGTLRGINIAPIHVIGESTTGITVSFVHTLEDMNGLAVSLVPTIKREANGFVIGLLYLKAKLANGLVVQGLFGGEVEEVNGVSLEWGSLAFLATGLLAGLSGTSAATTPTTTPTASSITPSFSPVGSKVINGVMIGGYNLVREQNGVLLALLGNRAEKGKGFQAGLLFNNAKNFHGVQIGLINHIGNNPFLFRWMPGINFHFGGDDDSEEGDGKKTDERDGR